MSPERIRQRFALSVLYCELDGDNWLNSGGGELWVSDLHECDWYTMQGLDPCGVQEQYQIIRPMGNMSGTLPPELSMISTLRVSLSFSYRHVYMPSIHVIAAKGKLTIRFLPRHQKSGTESQ